MMNGAVDKGLRLGVLKAFSSPEGSCNGLQRLMRIRRFTSMLLGKERGVYWRKAEFSMIDFLR